MTFDSIVFLGEHGSGKDTLGNYICEIVNNAGIVKFGLLGKQLTAKAFEVPLELLEDKDKRKEIALYQLSPLTFLNLLFQAGQLDTPEAKALRESYVTNALNRAFAFDFPVFTDIRRQEELDAVKTKYNPLVILLATEFSFVGAPGDEYIEQMYFNNKNEIHFVLQTVGLKTLENTKETLRNELRVRNVMTKEKPKVYLRNRWQNVVPGTKWLSFESFMDMFSEAGGFLAVISEDTAHAMVEAFLENANAHEIIAYLNLEDDESYSMLKCDVARLMIDTIAKTHDVYIELTENDFVKYHGGTTWN